MAKNTNGVNGSTQRSPKAARDQTKAEENRLKAVELHLKRFTQREIGRKIGVSASAVNGYIADYRAEIRSEGLLIMADVMADERAALYHNIKILEELHDDTKGYNCRGCGEIVECECGKAVQVPVLKPEGIIRNRGEIRAQSESLRKLIGIDADRTVIVKQMTVDGIKEIFRGMKDEPEEHRSWFVGYMADQGVILE